MRVVVQRVSRASVRVEGDEVGRIGVGLLVLVAFHSSDTVETLQWMARKIVSLRIFEDEDGRMNDDLAAVSGGVLVVSQFTLYGDCNKGKRPSFDKSAPANYAKVLYKQFIELIEREAPAEVESGSFQAHMEIDFVNDGPVTLILDKESS